MFSFSIKGIIGYNVLDRQRWQMNIHHQVHRRLQNDRGVVPCLSKPINWTSAGRKESSTIYTNFITEIWITYFIHERNIWRNIAAEYHFRCSRRLTPPSLIMLDIISMYSTILCAVSKKKQVTTASQVAARMENSGFRVRSICQARTISNLDSNQDL